MKNRTKKIAGCTLAGATIALLAYEFWSLSNKDDEDTISETYWRGVAKNPALNFAAGYLAGHLTWQSADVIEHFRKEANAEVLAKAIVTEVKKK